MSNARIINADCLTALRDMPDASVDAIVTDPPYGLSNTTPAQVTETITRWVSGDREYLPISLRKGKANCLTHLIRRGEGDAMHLNALAVEDRVNLPVTLGFGASAMIRAVEFSFFRWKGFGPLVDFVGLKNYVSVLTNDVFIGALLNNLFVVVMSIVIQLPVGIAVALLLNRKMRFQGFLRMIVFVPYVLAEVIAGVLGCGMQAPDDVDLLGDLALAGQRRHRLHRSGLNAGETVQLEGLPQQVDRRLLDDALGRQELREPGQGLGTSHQASISSVR